MRIHTIVHQDKKTTFNSNLKRDLQTERIIETGLLFKRKRIRSSNIVYNHSPLARSLTLPYNRSVRRPGRCWEASSTAASSGPRRGTTTSNSSRNVCVKNYPSRRRTTRTPRKRSRRIKTRRCTSVTQVLKD